MEVLNKRLLAGSPVEIEALARDAGYLLAPDDRLTGMRLLDLAIILAANPALRVSVVTYSDKSQELEVTLVGAPDSVIMVSRSKSGEYCQIAVDRWVPIGNDADRANSAGLITAIAGLDAAVNQQPRIGGGTQADHREPHEPA